MKAKIFLIDTSIWIEYFRRREDKRNLKIIKLVQRLESIAKVVTCGPILAEFISGLGKSQKELTARRILEAHDYLETPKEAYILGGELLKRLSQKGLKTPLSDCLIAATAITYGATLVSDDAHFRRFSWLKLEFIK